MKKSLLAILSVLFCSFAWAQNPPLPVIAPPAPSTAFGILARSGVSVPLTGTVAETVMGTVLIPGNFVGVNGQLRINTYWTFTNSANAKTVKLRLGGLAGTQISGGSFTTIPAARVFTNMIAANSTASQNSYFETSRGTDGLVTLGSLFTTAVDMTQNQNLAITAQLASAGETITLVGYTVELAN